MRRWRRTTWLCFFAASVGVGVAGALAGEHHQAFLESLRGREYYDLALDYLASMRTSPLADQAFRDVIDYEVGVTLIDGVHLLPVKERGRQLDEAARSIRLFMAAHPKHLLAQLAGRQLATIDLERGQAMLEQARQSGKVAAEKVRDVETARQQVLAAQQSLAEVDTQLNKLQKRYKDIDKSDLDLVRERDRIRAEIILTRMSLAKSVYILAQTHEAGSPERKKLLLEAAKKYGEYYAKYDRWLIRFSFRMEEARCYREAGEVDRAIDILEELADMDPVEEEAVRRIRTAATLMQMQTCLLATERRYGEAWRSYEHWRDNAQRPAECVSEAAVIKCLAGEAALELARSLDPRDTAAVSSREEYLRQARQLLSFAAKFSSELEVKARLRLMDPLLVEERRDVNLPKTYEEARDRAILAAARLREPKLRSNPPTQLCREALQCMRFALAHRPVDAPLDELNILRGCLAELSLTLGDEYEAAVLGEFLARRYGDRPQGQAGAKIALLAYDRLASEARRKDDRTLARERMRTMTQYAAERWPGSVTADDAWILLARAELNGKKPDQALEHLRRIVPQSARRGEADIIAGQILWQAYRDTLRLPEERQPPTAELAVRLSLARKTLDDGIQRVFKSLQTGDEIPYPLVAAILSLSEIELELGHAERATALLNDSRIGPATIAKFPNKISSRGSFQIDSLKAAIRAYLARGQLAEAEQIVTALEKNRRPKEVTQFYLNLGRQLEESLKRAQASGNAEEVGRAARSLEFLLTHIVSRPPRKSTFELLYWSAETFMRLGSAFEARGKALPAEAADYYGKAAQVYEKLAAICVEDESFAPKPEAIWNVRVRMARCQRRLGRFDDSVTSLAAILLQRPNALDVQCEIAATCQEWGQTKPEAYGLAIRGGRLPAAAGQEAVVWGWGGIAARIEGSERHQDVFHQARYQLAWCRMEQARQRSGNERREGLLQALQDIVVVQRLHPDMGGKKWYNQYDELLRQIQQSLGVPRSEQGLTAAERQEAAPAE